MELFSERYGFSSVRTVVQFDVIEPELRIGLWNALVIHYFTRDGSVWLKDQKGLHNLFSDLWLNYFKRPLHFCR